MPFEISNIPALIPGSGESNISAMIPGNAEGSISAYLTGGIVETDNQPVYTHGQTTDLDNSPAFAHGGVNTTSNNLVYLAGGAVSNDNQANYLFGVEVALDSISAYTKSEGSGSSSIYAYLLSEHVSTKTAYLEGQTMSVSYITLTTSDASLSVKFRVIAAGYDDGSLEKAESRVRTIGGGIDHAMGAVYKTWTPTIKVRHTESDAGYGTLAELEYLYSLNNPNGTPSNVLTFTDHHSVQHQVRTVGPFQKSFLGSSIEGSEAWAVVQIRLERVFNEQNGFNKCCKCH